MSIPSHAFEQHTVAFYNLENLFDYSRDKHILDSEFTATGRKEWTQQRYEKKLKNLSNAISLIGYDKTGKPPAVLGVAEVENKKVLKDLISQPALIEYDYDFIHYNSPDERGIDVALLYRKQYFTPDLSQPVHIDLKNEDGIVDQTRDILYVKGSLASTPLHIYVNHWPSRRDGAASTQDKRIATAAQLIAHINSVDKEYSHHVKDHVDSSAHKFIVMGDFNDDPENDSITKGILPYGFENITAPLKNHHRGSLNYNKKWNLFDQIIISNSMNHDIKGQLYFQEANIYDDIMLRQWKGKYRGQPSRTFSGRHYKGGYSDHFPVYAVLRRN